MNGGRTLTLAAAIWAGWVAGWGAGSQDPRDRRIEQLETQVEALTRQVEAVVSELQALKNEPTQEEVPKQAKAELPALDRNSWVDRFTLGGYGEVHSNFSDAAGEDQIDLHRVVLDVDYQFDDWINFYSEVELEHALVSGDAEGEVGLEQAYIEFLLCDAFNVRAGRVLTPVGITNLHHEPPRVWGVERPSFDRVVIPSTRFSDGIGAFGAITPSLKYEAYVVAGLDGTGFSPLEGIREGRIEDIPSWNDPAFTGRLDYYPFALRENPHGQNLRLGVSTYVGGLDNGKEGDNPGINSAMQLYSADAEYSILDLELRGALAWIHLDDAENLPDGVAEEILGGYLEAGWHCWPEAWQRGRLADSDALLFVRHEEYDTQYDMPSGRNADPAGDRREWAFGVQFYPVPNLVLKADFHLLDDATGDDLDNLFNLGLGWQF